MRYLLLLSSLILVPAAFGDTFMGKCELTANGKSAGERNCRITTNANSGGNCPGKLAVYIAYDWQGTNGWGAFFDVTDGTISGSCTTEYATIGVSGSLGGGEISGTLTHAYQKGSRIGTTVEIRFQGTTPQ